MNATNQTVKITVVIGIVALTLGFFAMQVAKQYLKLKYSQTTVTVHEKASYVFVGQEFPAEKTTTTVSYGNK